MSDATGMDVNRPLLEEVIYRAQDDRYSEEVRRQVAHEAARGGHGSGLQLSDMVALGRATGWSVEVNQTLATVGQGDPPIAGIAVAAYLEEVGHWADIRAQRLSGQPYVAPPYEEGALFALKAVTQLTEGRSGNLTFDIPHANGGSFKITANATLLKASVLSSVESGRLFKETRDDGHRHWEAGGHFCMTYTTATGVGEALGNTKTGTAYYARAFGLGAQIGDMFTSYDAASHYKDKYIHGPAKNFARALSRRPIFPSWTKADEQHMRLIYDGLHAIPECKQGTSWSVRERQKTKNYILNQSNKDGNIFAAGVAIHRFGDLYAQVHKEDETPYYGDSGHMMDSAWGEVPDATYVGNSHGREKTNAAYRLHQFKKIANYKKELAKLIAEMFVYGKHWNSDFPANKGKWYHKDPKIMQQNAIGFAAGEGIKKFNQYYSKAHSDEELIGNILHDYGIFNLPARDNIKETKSGVYNIKDFNDDLVHKVARDLKSEDGSSNAYELKLMIERGNQMIKDGYLEERGHD